MEEMGDWDLIWGFAGPPVNFWRPKPSLSHGVCKEARSCWEVPGGEGLRLTVPSVSGPPDAVLFSQAGHEAQCQIEVPLPEGPL